MPVLTDSSRSDRYSPLDCSPVRNRTRCFRGRCRRCRSQDRIPAGNHRWSAGNPYGSYRSPARCSCDVDCRRSCCCRWADRSVASRPACSRHRTGNCHRGSSVRSGNPAGRRTHSPHCRSSRIPRSSRTRRAHDSFHSRSCK